MNDNQNRNYKQGELKMNGKKLIVTLLSGLMGVGSLLANDGSDVAVKPEKAMLGKREHVGKRQKKQKRLNGKQRRRILHYLKANYPEEMQAIKKLGETDPAAAKEKLKALAKKGFAKIQQERQAFHKLIKEYRETQDEAILAKIRTRIAAVYDKRMNYAEKAVDNLDKKLKKAKERLEQLQKNRDKNIDKIIDRIKNGKGKGKGRMNREKRRRHKKHEESDD